MNTKVEDRAEDLIIAGAAGGGDEPRQPVEDPDNLQSNAFLSIIDLIGEGEIGGLVSTNGSNNEKEKSIRLNETPLRHQSGELNFSNVSWAERKGTQVQSYIESFGEGVETPFPKGVQLKAYIANSFVVSSPDVDRVKIILAVNALTNTDTTNGDISGSSVSFDFRLATNGGPYRRIAIKSITGKTTARYQRSFVFDLPKSESNGTPITSWSMQVIRETPDSTTSSIQNDSFFESYSEISLTKFSYPNSALVATRFSSETFSSIPKREYLVDGLLIEVPSNYNPKTRAYTGIWDGTYKLATTDNPAWILYDLLLNERYGLGRHITIDMIDEARLYQIAQYCDQLVDDGFGNLEPRYRINCVINSRVAAYDLIVDICSAFNGMAYWAGDMVGFTIDAPSEPTMLVNNTNIVGDFSYSGTSVKDRHSIAVVTWNDPEDDYKQVPESVEDAELIARYGIRKTEVMAFGCTSRGQAARYGRWLLYSEHQQSEMISFKLGLDSSYLLPGDLIQIQDRDRAGKRLGGRLLGCTSISAVLDDEIDFETLENLEIDLRLEDGTVVSRPIATRSTTTVPMSGGTKTVTKVTWDTPIEKLPVELGIWIISSSDLSPILARVVNIGQSDQKSTFEITAIPHNPNKYVSIENGLMLEVPKTTMLNSRNQASPESVQIESEIIVSQGIAKTRMVISWKEAKGASQYEVEWKRNNGNWVKLPRTASLSVEIEDVYAGNYTARVYALNIFGSKSYPRYSDSIDLQGKTGKPLNAVGFTVTPLLFGMKLDWVYPANSSDTSYVAIQVSDFPSGATPRLVGNFAYPANTHSIQGLQGNLNQWYRIKLVDKTGNESDWSNFVKGTTSNDPSQVLEILEGHIGSPLFDQTTKDSLAQIQTNANAITKEVSDRVTAIAAEATNRANAIAKEVNDRNSAISVETTNRTNAINTAISVEVTNRTNAINTAITKEVNDRNTAITTKATEINNSVDSKISTVTTSINKEVQDRKDAVTSETNSRIAAISSLQDGLTTETNQRKSEDASLLTNIETFKTSTNNSLASVQQQTTTNSTAISSQASQITALDSRLTTADKTANDAKTAAATAQTTANTAVTKSDANATNITSLSASLGALDSDSLVPDYNLGNPSSWVSHYSFPMQQYFKTTTTGKVSNTVFRKDVSVSSFCWNYSIKTLPNTRSYKVSFWVRRSADSNGAIYVTVRLKNNLGVFYNYAYQAINIAQVPATETWVLITQVVNFTNLTDATNIALGFAIGHGGNAGWWELQGYRITSVITNDDTDSTIATAAALSILDTKVTTIDGKVTSNSQSITALNNDLTTVKNNVSTKADASSVTALQSTVTSQGNTISSQGTAITNLTNKVSTVEGTVSTKADASTVTALDNKVTTQGNTITTQGTSITSLTNRMTTVEGNVATKADASALNTLDSKVTTIDGKLTSTSSSLTSLQSNFSALPNAGVNLLGTTITNPITKPTNFVSGLIFDIEASTDTPQVNRYKFTIPTTAGNGTYLNEGGGSSTANMRLYAKGKYILSFYAKVSTGTHTIDMKMYNVGFSTRCSLDTTLRRFSLPVEITAVNGSQCCPLIIGNPLALSNVGTIYIERMMFESQIADNTTPSVWVDGTNVSVDIAQSNAKAQDLFNTASTATSAVASRATALEARMNSAETNISNKAEASALGSLDTKVTNIQGTVTSQGTDITQLKNNVTSIQGTVSTKADSTALNALDSKVTTIDGKVTSNTTSITQLNGKVTDVDTKANTAITNAATAQTTANTAVSKSDTNAANITSLNTSLSATNTTANRADLLSKYVGGGKPMTDDPTFATTNGSIALYGSVGTLARAVKQTDNPTSSGYEMVRTATASLGVNNGWHFTTISTAANRVILIKQIVKLPVGFQFDLRSNAIGTGGTLNWLSSNLGTGRYETYWALIKCGDSGTFGTTGHIAISPVTGTPQPTSEVPLVAYLASYEWWDVTTVNDTIPKQWRDSITAGASATSALTTRVTNAEGTITSQGNSITSLQNSVSSINGTLATKADATAVTALQSTVTSQGTTLTSQGNSITSLQNGLTTTNTNVDKKADITALNALDTKVTQQGNTVTSQGSQINALNAAITASLTEIKFTANVDALASVRLLNGGLVVPAKINLVDEPTATTGKVLRLGNDTASDYIIGNGLTYVAIDVNKMYRVKYRFRRKTGDGSVYLSLVCMNAEKTSHVTSSNVLTTLGNVSNSCYYVVANQQPLDTWVTGEAYFKGKSSAGSTGTGTFANPKTFPALSAFFCLGILANYSSGAGTQDFDYIIVEDYDASAANNATASALTTLDTKVTQQGNTLSTQSGQITSLQNSLSVTNTNTTAAQTAAQNALDQANTKGKVIYGTTTPTAADQLSQNLWIDTTNGANTPKRWNGTSWLAVTDKVATDAAAAAQSALTQLSSKADASALSSLDSKVTTIDGKVTTNSNSITSLSGRVTTVENNLSSKADASALNNYYTKTQADSATAGSISNFNASLVIGGVNAAYDTELERSSLAATNREYFMYERSTELKAFYDENLNKPITISFDMSVPVAGNILVYSSNNSAHEFSTTIAVTEVDKFVRYSVTVNPRPHSSTPNNAASTIEFFGTYGTGRIPTIRKLKIEAGNKATAWSPSPRDTKASLAANATAIQNVDTKVTNTNGVVTSQGAAITSLQNSVTSINGVIATKADSSALQTLQNTVTQQGNTITSQGTSITNVVAQANTTQSRITVQDTRSDNQPPSWYWANYPKLIVNELKQSSAIGLPAGFPTYVNLETRVYWSDSSAGNIIQTAKAVNDPKIVAERYSSGSGSSATWVAWQQPLKQLNDTISATASAQTALDAKVTTIDGKVTSQASTLTSLSTAVNGNTLSLNEQSAVINGVKGIKTLTIDNNGVISGYGLVSELVNGQVTATFGINATNFYIGPPSSNKKLFVVATTPQNINGTIYPAGTWIDSAYIANATIKLAHIDTASITSLSAVSATIGTFKTAETGRRVEIGDNGIRIFGDQLFPLIEIGDF